MDLAFIFGDSIFFLGGSYVILFKNAFLNNAFIGHLNNAFLNNAFRTPASAELN